MKPMKPKDLDKLVTLRDCQAACEKRNLATYGSIEMLKNRLREDDGTGKKKPGPKPGAPRKVAEQKADDDQQAVHIHLPTKLDAATMKTLQYKFVREEVGAPLPFVYKKAGDKEVASPSPKALGKARAESLVFPHKSKELYGKVEQTNMNIVLDSFDKTAEFPYTWVKATDSSSPAATKKRVLGSATDTSKKQKPAGSPKDKTIPAGSPKQKTTPAAAPKASVKTGSYVTPTLFSSKDQTKNGIQLEERSSGMCIYSVVDETKFKRQKLDRFAEEDDVDDDADAAKKKGADDDDDDDMRWANEVLHGRLMKVSNHPNFRQWLCQGLDMFKVDYSEKDSKRNLATMLTEQVHYETDDSDEDEDNEDDDDEDDDNEDDDSD